MVNDQAVDLEKKIFGDHPNHNNHFCVYAAKQQIDKIRGLAKNPNYICNICGRVADKETNLCEPAKL